METEKREDGQVEAGEGRKRWDNKFDFFMASISSTIGLGNLWRFPYICYRNGGGAFLIPFIVMVVFVGFPLITLELALGQFSGKGPVGVWRLCPMFAGIGWCMLVMNFVCTTYYVMLIGYSLYYVAASFTHTLPWSTCDNYWNTPRCFDERAACADSGGLWMNGTCLMNQLPQLNVTVPDYYDTQWSRSFPSEEYFYFKVLGISSGISELGSVRGLLVLALLVAWALLVLGLSLGTKSWGKMSYVTTLLPYLVMLILFIRACLMPGATTGIRYFITPNWNRLGQGQVWIDAAIQVFFSVGCGWGNFITLGKHNRFHNNPIVDSGVLVIGDIVTSLLCGFVVFAVLGQMAFQANLSINEVASSGPSLAFVVYPRAVLALPAPQFWSAVFFLMMICLGLGSAMPQVENILGTLTDEFKVLRSRKNRFFTLLVLVAIYFFFGLLYTTNGGMYVLTLVDSYGPSFPLLVIGFFEVMVVAWIYGSGRFLRDLSSMTGWSPNHFFTIFWRGVCPLAILALLILSAVFWVAPCSIFQYCFPRGAHIAGWILTGLQIAIIPVYLIVCIIIAAVRRLGWRRLVRPTQDWGREAMRNEPAGMIHPTTEHLITSKV